MKHKEESCLPLQILLDSGWQSKVISCEGKPKHLRKRAKPRKASEVQVVSASIFEVLQVAALAAWSRLPLVLLLCTAALIVSFLATYNLFGAVSKALPFSPVFSAPIHDTFNRNEASQLEQLIPRVVHQTAKSFDSLSVDINALRQTWVRLNPGWEVKLWDDARCKDFVKQEFPEYFAAYTGLAKNVERADFFRYLVVLRYGGVYADIDTECTQPLDDAIRSDDTLVVGWEGEEPSWERLMNRHFARYRQVCNFQAHGDSDSEKACNHGHVLITCSLQVQQWFFAAAPGHPALRRVCDHIAAHYRHRFSEYSSIDTLERTGPGAWTDAVLSTAHEHSPMSSGDWATRFLPQVATGTRADGSTPGLLAGTPGVYVLHHFMGSWKDRRGYPKMHIFRKFQNWLFPPGPVGELVAPATQMADPMTALYPVSVNHHGTVFTMMVNLVGHGDLQSHEDVSAMLTRFGNWQAGMDNTMVPRAPVALVGALSKIADTGKPPILLDIGAGLGFYTLTAAVRGYNVVASELAPRSIRALQASLHENRVQKQVRLRNVTLGAEEGMACVQPGAGAVAAYGWRPEEISRGYGPPQVHARTAGSECDHAVKRMTMAALVPAGVRVGAVRVSAGAWTGEVLKGGLPMLQQHRPAAVLVEVDMAEMARIRSTGFQEVIREMYEMGYSNMGHAGSVCRQRFEIMVTTLQKRSTQGVLQTDIADLRQPAWCDLSIENLSDVVEQNKRNGQDRQLDSTNAPGIELFLLQLNSPAPEPEVDRLSNDA